MPPFRSDPRQRLGSLGESHGSAQSCAVAACRLADLAGRHGPDWRHGHVDLCRRSDLILGSDWGAWAKAMGPLNHAPSQLVASLIWLVVMVLIGVTGMWIYAAVRSRLTPGPATAAKVGVAVWVCAFFAPELGNIALGAYPMNTIVVG